MAPDLSPVSCPAPHPTLSFPKDTNSDNNKVRHRYKGAMVFQVTHLPADSNEQTLGRLQLELRFTQQQTQHLQNLAVFGGDVGKRHPVDVARQGVQGGHGDAAVSSGL